LGHLVAVFGVDEELIRRLARRLEATVSPTGPGEPRERPPSLASLAAVVSVSSDDVRARTATTPAQE
jgi:hypothetical protein